MDRNPIQCDCNIYDLLKYVNEESVKVLRNNIRISIYNLKCKGPPELKETNIQNLHYLSHTCKINKSKFASDTACGIHENGECSFRPHDKTLIINCSDKDLEKIPKVNNLKNVKRIELYLQSNNLTKMSNFKNSMYNKVEIFDLSNNKISDVADYILHGNLQVINKNLYLVQRHKNFF